MTIGVINSFNSVLLVDYRYMGYRSAYRFKDFSVNKENGPILTGSIFGILQFIELVSTNYPFMQIILCLDGKPVERQKLFEGYKKSRIHRDPSKPQDIESATFRALHDEPFKMLGGIPNLMAVKHPEKEADDLIAKLAYLNKEAGKDVVVFTSDKDMMQLMAKDINISKEINEGELVLLKEDYVLNHDKLGVEPKYIPYLRPWKGDPSDDIPAAVSRVPSTILKEVAEGWYNSGSNELTTDVLENILDNCTVNVTPNSREKLLAGIQTANLNFKLMDLTRYETEAIDGVELVPLDFNLEAIRYYDLKKYEAWRTGKTVTTVDPDALIAEAVTV